MNSDAFKDLKIHSVPINDVFEADYNPRQMSEGEADEIEKSLSKFGFVEPVIVNQHPERKNMIVGGAQRTKIAKKLGYTHIPVVYVNLDKDKEMELNVRLNKNQGSWSIDKLANFFNSNELIEWGFSPSELGIDPNSGKEAIDKDNLADTLDTYLDSDIKQVVLYFKATEFQSVLDRLSVVMEKEGLTNHTEAVLSTLKAWEKENGIHHENPGTE
jgi:ParB-like nuclease family protein